MEYFRMEQDERIKPHIVINQLRQFLEIDKIMRGHIKFLPYAVSLPVNSSKYNFFPDVLSRQIVMVKENVFDVIRMYVPKLEYRCVFLYDQIRKQSEFYYVPYLEMMECFSENSNYNLDRSVIKKTVLKNVDNSLDIFRVANVKDRVVIISLRLAESLLRRQVNGIYISNVYFE